MSLFSSLKLKHLVAKYRSLKTMRNYATRTISDVKEEIQKKEKWIADTKRKIEKKIWDAGCDKFKVTEKLEDLDEHIESVSDFLDEARKRYPKYFKNEGF